MSRPLERVCVMTETGEPTPAGDPVRHQVLDAALAELVANHFDRFTLEKVAARAGVDVLTVRQQWPNTPELLIAALTEYGDRYVPMPDTGSLRDDLMHYAKSYAETMNSPLGRRLADALIVRPRDWDVAGSRASFLERRTNDRAIALVRRGVERGDCSPDTDPVRAADLIVAGLSLPVMLYDRPITAEHCEFVVDTVLNGIAPGRGRAHS